MVWIVLIFLVANVFATAINTRVILAQQDEIDELKSQLQQQRLAQLMKMRSELYQSLHSDN